MMLMLQQVLRQGGHESTRETVGSKHREDDGFRKGHKQVPRYATEKEHRQENDADAKRGY